MKLENFPELIDFLSNVNHKHPTKFFWIVSFWFPMQTYKYFYNFIQSTLFLNLQQIYFIL